MLVAPAKTAGAECRQHHPIAAAMTQKHSVLIVDDDADATEALSLLFQHTGYEAFTAHTGERALKIARAVLPSAIISDLGLAGMSGFDLCRSIRAMPGGASLPIISLSGRGLPEDAAESKAAGFTAHVVKPASFEHLAALIAAALAVPDTEAAAN